MSAPATCWVIDDAFLIDDLVAERNACAKEVMEDVHEQRKELAVQ